jgi:putative restriction endonuclease
MNSAELKERIKNLTIWKKGDQRAPHKPLLILYALGQMQHKKARFLSYVDTKEPMKDLLKEFGPYRQTYHPEEPFVRLTNDGIWTLNRDVDSVQINGHWLSKHGVLGGFNDEVYSLLRNDPNLVQEITEMVLHNHFPETVHEDILTAVGLDFDTCLSNQHRDSKFRDRVLKAYEFSCAVCGFNVRLGNNLIAVEAAHIKWHQAGGPDKEENGIALCAMHHKLFDRGVFTITDSKELLVAEEANGTQGFQEWLMRYHGQQIRLPIHPDYQPKSSFVNWHIREVFRGPGRYKM